MSSTAPWMLTWGLEYDVARAAIVNSVALTPTNCRVECQSATTAAVRATAAIPGRPISGFLRKYSQLNAGQYDESTDTSTAHEDLDHLLRVTPEAACCLRGYLPTRCAEAPQRRHSVLRVILFHRQPSRHPLPARTTQYVSTLQQQSIRVNRAALQARDTRNSPEAAAQHS